MVLETYFYDTLLVPVTATADEISRSYKKLALKYHPDKTHHDPELTEKFKVITRAYEVLRDPLQRLVYDAYGREGVEGQVSDCGPPPKQQKQSRPGPQQWSRLFPSAKGPSFGFQQAMFSQFFTDMSSIFDTARTCSSQMNQPFFEMGAHVNPSSDSVTRVVQPAPAFGDRSMRRGSNIHHTFKVTLGDMFYGKVAKFQLPKSTRCSYCDGAGCFNPKTCSTCEGSGAVMVTVMNNFSKIQERSGCSVCNGKGIVCSPQDVCRRCEDGYLVVKKILRVGILPGTKNGDQVILKGQSDEGKNIIPGDVIIHLEEQPHPFLVRRGNDLYMERAIDLKTALLGGRIVVLDFPGPGEDIIVKINTHKKTPSASEVVGTIQSGAVKIVKGLGNPINPTIKNNRIYQDPDQAPVIGNISNFLRGDLFIRFNVIIPSISELSRTGGLERLCKFLPGGADEEAFSMLASEHLLANLPGEEVQDKQCQVQIDEKNGDDENSSDNYDYEQLDIGSQGGSEELEDKHFYEQQWSKEDANNNKRQS